jgi:hypothetical protein
MAMKTLKQFREEEGLGDLTPKTDVSGTETELSGEILELLRKHADQLRVVLTKSAHGNDSDFENDMRTLVGMIGNLKEKPREKKKLSDPMNNVVTRSFAGPDSGGGDGGAEGG